jgi:carbohydrate-selective porin OprB
VRPVAEGDPQIITLITRVGWAQPDRSPLGLFIGASLAYHGLGTRSDDTAGVGFGWLGSEWYAEVFYKLRITRFLSVQPDLQFYRTPGGAGPDAVLVGLRLKVKL